MKTLLVFDINGTLLLRKNNNVYVRNGLQKLKDYCFSIADVAIYTSMLNKNIKLEHIFSNDEIERLVFIWDRSKTIKDKNGINKWDTLKSLEYIKKEYPNYDKIIIIDDSENKLRFIPIENKIIINPFENINENDGVLVELIDLIKSKLSLNEKFDRFSRS